MKGRPNRHNPRFVLRVAQVAPRAGNALSEYLAARRWLDPVQVWIWLQKTHPRLVGTARDERDLEPEAAREAVRLVREHLGRRRRRRGD